MFNADKRSFLHHLDDIQGKLGRRTASFVSKALRQRILELVERFNSLDNMLDKDISSDRPLNLLYDLIRALELFRVTHGANLISLLNSLQDVNPSTRDYIPQAIQDITQYWRTSYYLVSMARRRKYRVFSHIRVGVVQILLPGQNLYTEQPPTFEEAWLALFNESHVLGGKNRFASPRRALGASYPIFQQKFQNEISRCNKARKVHAEIQLLVFYATQPQRKRPRIIASNKDSCYLCNLFMQLHGSFQTARTHGRIYCNWVLPDWVPLTEAEQECMVSATQRLNKTIEQKFVAVLNSRAGLAVQKCRNRPKENSPFNHDPLSASTLAIVPSSPTFPTPPASILGRVSLRSQMATSAAASSRTLRGPVIPRPHDSRGFTDVTQLPTDTRDDKPISSILNGANEEEAEVVIPSRQEEIQKDEEKEEEGEEQDHGEKVETEEEELEEKVEEEEKEEQSTIKTTSDPISHRQCRSLRQHLNHHHYQQSHLSYSNPSSSHQRCLSNEQAYIEIENTLHLSLTWEGNDEAKEREGFIDVLETGRAQETCTTKSAPTYGVKTKLLHIKQDNEQKHCRNRAHKSPGQRDYTSFNYDREDHSWDDQKRYTYQGSDDEERDLDEDDINNELNDIIDPRTILPGESHSLTVDRGGWQSRKPLLVSCGDEKVVAIKYFRSSA